MLARYMFSISLRNSWDWEMQQGQHGIGACVSAFARQHGQEVRTQYGAANLEHERNHAGPRALRHEASPASNQ